MSPFLDGFLIGLAMIVFVGPVFFTLLQISVSEGVASGMMVALGVVISDIVCVVICYYVSSEFLATITQDRWISILGGVILGSIGLKYVIKPSLNTHVVKRTTTFSMIGAFSKGFLANFVNPFVFGIWIAVINAMQTTYTETEDQFAYLAAANLAIFMTDSSKAMLSQKLSSLLTPKKLRVIYLVIGIIMIGFAIRLFKHAFVN